MSIILDLVLIAIIAFCGWSGYRKGFILGISGIVALIIAFYGAQLVANTYSQEFTSVMKPFVSGIVDGAVDEAKDNAAKENKENDVYEVTYDALGNIGIIKSAAQNIADEISQKVTQTGQALREALVDSLCSKIAYVLTAVIVFLLIVIVFTVLANILNLAFKLPGLELVNDILGTAFGVAKGLIFAFTIAWVMRYMGFLINETIINKTIILEWMMEHNLVAKFFGF